MGRAPRDRPRACGWLGGFDEVAWQAPHTFIGFCDGPVKVDFFFQEAEPAADPWLRDGFRALVDPDGLAGRVRRALAAEPPPPDLSEFDVHAWDWLWAMHLKLRRPGHEWLVYVELVKFVETMLLTAFNALGPSRGVVSSESTSASLLRRAPSSPTRFRPDPRTRSCAAPWAPPSTATSASDRNLPRSEGCRSPNRSLNRCSKCSARTASAEPMEAPASAIRLPPGCPTPHGPGTSGARGDRRPPLPARPSGRDPMPAEDPRRRCSCPSGGRPHDRRSRRDLDESDEPASPCASTARNPCSHAGLRTVERRRGWDSNPRYACTHNGFRDRPIQPLSHPSESAHQGSGSRWLACPGWTRRRSRGSPIS